MKKITLLLFLVFSLLTTSCGDDLKQENQLLKAENQSLTQKVENLTKEIEHLKFGPEKMLSQAKHYADAQKYNQAKSELQSLINKHPATQQAEEAKKLMVLVSDKIKELADAEEKVKKEAEKAKAEKLANATKKLRTSYDDMRDITWYYDKGTPKYRDVNSFHLYMSKSKNSTPNLRFAIQYTASSWLFIESYIIKTDNNSYTITPTRKELERDNGYGGIWEWYDVLLDKRMYHIIKDVIQSKNAKIRYNGKQYYDDKTISQKEKMGLQNILDAYEALGGSFDRYE